MSLLSDSLTSGSSSVIGSLIAAGPTQPFFAPASGGGGGGGGSTSSIGAGLASVECDPASSAIFLTTSGANGDIIMTTNTGGIFSLQADDIMLTNNIGYTFLNISTSQVTVGGTGPVFVSPNVSTQNLLVSSINGAAPGGGPSLFQSTFNALAIPANTSTILLEVPAGQFGFNGLYLQNGASAYLNGFVNTTSFSDGPFYYGAIQSIAASQPADTAPVVMTLNNGDSVLSTIKLIVTNNNATAGTFTGVVAKLY